MNPAPLSLVPSPQEPETTVNTRADVATGVHRRVAASKTSNKASRQKKLSTYQRVLKVMEAFREIGTPVDGRRLGVGNAILVTSARAAGAINACLCFRDDRYVVECQVNVKPLTDSEQEEMAQTGLDPTNLKAFNALFDLMRLRQQMPTFAPEETAQVVTAIECIFGCFG